MRHIFEQEQLHHMGESHFRMSQDLVTDRLKEQLTMTKELRLKASNAVWGRRLCKSYGKGKNKLKVLTGLNINVPFGAIYGLLGPSGCGKTTLLRCIVGLMKVDSGSLLAMGDVPSAPGHSIPGPMVGYMPQEISLYNELTIQEMLYFFGSVHGMTKSDIKHRTAFLLDFLKLPRHPTPIQQLSGGQKRRTSLAVALLHKPGLLILDEPTVGVDPLLREKIWEHLLEIAQSSEQTTIIVTTHYIEEARQADRVGLMRGGRLLDEDRPSKLMEQYSMTSLESIFLHLCHHDVIGNAQDEEFMSLSQSENDHLDSATSDEYQVNYDNRPLITTEVANSQSSNGSSSVYGTVSISGLPSVKPQRQHWCTLPSLPRFRCILALFIKNMIILKRSIGLLLFEFFVPSSQIILFCLCIGRMPQNVKLAVVNLDEGSMGALYLQHLGNSTLIQVPFDNLDAGKKSVENGDTWGALYISLHFSEDMFLRLIMGINVTTEVVEGSTVYLYLDLTDSEISSFIQISTLESFQDFSKTQLEQFGFNAHYSDSPVQIGDPIYGKKGSTLTQFMAPGILLSISFFMAIGLTALAFVLEKKEGLYERNLVSGVNPAEVMIAHVITQFLVLVVQVSLLLLFTFTVFDITVHGSMGWVMSLILLQGLCGMCLGIMISSLCDSETSAIQVSLGIIYPLLLISGILWPVQAVPEALAYISKSLPLTLPTEALRSVMSRGWGLQHFSVWIGFIVDFGWCFLFLCITGIIIRLKG